MKDAFQINAPRLTGPSPTGSLHAAASLSLPVSKPSAPAPVSPYPVISRPAPRQSQQPSPVAAAPLEPRPLVSFVVSTFNRRDVLLQTVDQIGRWGLRPDEYEVLIVDNAST